MQRAHAETIAVKIEHNAENIEQLTQRAHDAAARERDAIAKLREQRERSLHAEQRLRAMHKDLKTQRERNAEVCTHTTRTRAHW